MDHERHIISTAEKLGVIRPRDVNAPRTVLSELVAQGVIERTGWGLYRLAQSEPSEHHSLVEISASVPHAVVSLLSALQFHGIGTQSPYQVWITIDVRARKPRLKYPPLRIMRASGIALTAGICSDPQY